MKNIFRWVGQNRHHYFLFLLCICTLILCSECTTDYTPCQNDKDCIAGEQCIVSACLALRECKAKTCSKREDCLGCKDGKNICLQGLCTGMTRWKECSENATCGTGFTCTFVQSAQKSFCLRSCRTEGYDDPVCQKNVEKACLKVGPKQSKVCVFHCEEGKDCPFVDASCLFQGQSRICIPRPAQPKTESSERD